jgi:mannose-6-phosphate isomerase-like protein (cupin superfamily)
MRVGPNEITIKLQNAAFSIIEYKVGPRFIAPPVLHWHEDTDFAGIVLEGRVQFRFADRTEDVAADAVIYVPRNTKFAWANPDDAPARMLFIYSPAGFEQYFVELESLLDANPGKTIGDLMPHVMPLWKKYKIRRD